MALDRLGPAWAALQTELRARVRALVVDDEAVVRELLTSVLEMSGYTAESVETAEAALEAVRAGRFDLLVTDKNLPGHDGVDLIAQLRAEGFDLPAVLVTGYPSPETISAALARGAADYITKPFDDVGHVQKRIESVVEQHRAGILFDRIVQDLKDVVAAEGAGAEVIGQVARALFAFKQALAARPDVLVVEPDPRLARLTSLFLGGAGLKVVRPSEVRSVRAWVEAADGPLSVFLSLDVPDAVDLVRDLAHRDLEVEIVVSGRASQPDEAIEAVAAGASDFVLGAQEGLDLLAARVKRAAARARKHRLYLHLLATLYQAGQSLGTDVAERLASVVPESQRPHLAALAEPAGALPEEDVDLDDLFEDESPDLRLDIDVAPMAEAARGADAFAGAGAERVRVGEQIAFGIDTLDPSRTVQVPLTDLLRVYATLGELIRFFHEPAHFADAERVRAFIGDAQSGALAAMVRSYYEDLRAVLPPDVVRDLDAGRFDHPRRPTYLP